MSLTDDQKLIEMFCPVDLEHHSFTVKNLGDETSELSVYWEYCAPSWQPPTQHCVPSEIIGASILCFNRNGAANLFTEDNDICDLVAKHVGATFIPRGCEYGGAYNQTIGYQATSVSLDWVDFTSRALPAFGATALFKLPFSIDVGSGEFQRAADQFYLKQSIMMGLRIFGPDNFPVESIAMLQRIIKNLDIRFQREAFGVLHGEAMKKLEA